MQVYTERCDTDTDTEVQAHIHTYRHRASGTHIHVVLQVSRDMNTHYIQMQACKLIHTQRCRHIGMHVVMQGDTHIYI